MANATKKSVPVSEFVTVYMTSDTMQQVIDATGLTKGSIQSKASHLRKKGVKLPKKFNSGRVTMSIDVDALNKIIEQNGTKPSTTTAPAATTTTGKKGKK